MNLERLMPIVKAHFFVLKKQEDRLASLCRETSRKAQATGDAIDRAMALYLGALHRLEDEESAFLQNPLFHQWADDVVSSAMVPYPGLFGKEDPRVHTAVLALMYSALRNANLFYKREAIARALREIKAHLYTHHIAGGRLMSDDGRQENRFDTLFACVPFGLLEPEDLVLVDAVQEMRKVLGQDPERLTDFERLLLAWYDAEQGSYAEARDLLGSVKDDHVLKKLVATRLASVGQLQEDLIRHRPLGNGNRYEPGADERHPWFPLGGEAFTLDAITSPLSESRPLLLELNGKLYEGDLLSDRWRFELEGRPGGEDVSYRFFYRDQPEIASETFRFSVGRVLYAEDLRAVYRDERRLFFFDDHGCLAFEAMEDRLAFSLAPYDEGQIGEWAEGVTGEVVSLGGYEIRFSRAPFTFSVGGPQGLLLRSVEDHPLSWIEREGCICATGLRFQLEDTRIYGLGERYNAFDQWGQQVDQFVYNQYKDQGLRTYLPMPLFYTTAGFGMSLSNEGYSVLDFGRDRQGELQLYVEEQHMEGQLVFGSLQEQVRTIHHVHGPAKMIPEWALGPWMSSNNWDSDHEVRRQVAETEKHGIPATVLVIEAWSDEATFYIFNDAVYEERTDGSAHAYGDFTFPEWGRWPDPKGLIDYLHEKDLKCLLWQIPIIKQITSLHHLQKSYDESHALARGYCVKEASGAPYRLPEGWFKDSLLMDFSHEEGKQWWFDKRKYLVEELAVDGFKTDGGEFVFGNDLAFHDGKTGREMRNAYPNAYIGAYYDFIRQNDGITFSRAGYTGAQRYPAHWAGDERSTFDAFKRSMLAGLSAGLSGVIFWGWDLAGFSGEIPNVELFIRSTQMAAFCPIMQYHAESKAEFNQDRTPWNIAERWQDERAIAVYRFYANLRMSLIPYLHQASKEAILRGEPLMKPYVLDFEEDPATHDLWDAYLLGPSLLVAPVIEEGARLRNLYLPEGRWWSLFEERFFEGARRIEVEAPIDRIPVFVRDGSILPMDLNPSGLLGDAMPSSLEDYQRLTLLIVGSPEGLWCFSGRKDLEIRVTSFTDEEGVLTMEVEAQDHPLWLHFAGGLELVHINGRRYRDISILPLKD